MDDSVLLIIVFRGVLSLLFVCAGIGALVVGARLYLRGVGVEADGSSIDAGKGSLNVKASLKTVGSVVMFTSVAWGLLAYLSLPQMNSSVEEGKRTIHIPRLPM